MRIIYTTFLYLLTPFIIIRLYWKSIKLSDYRKRINERFNLNRKFEPCDILVHAVSLGEVIAATPLIEELLKRNLKVFVTTLTPTGSKQVLAKFGDKVGHQYMPYDLPFLLKRFFKQLNAKVAVILETELWPNMLAEAKRQNMQLLLVNGRISDKAIKKYQKIRFFLQKYLNYFNYIGVQSNENQHRFINLGAKPEKVFVLGNIKFDNKPHVINNDFNSFKQKWGENRPVIILASTHQNEEELFLSALKNIQREIPEILLLIAPRHPERFNLVYDLSCAHGFKTYLRTNEDSIEKNAQVIILNSLGELCNFFHLSDYVFVGGSLVPIGGHNVLEPIALNKPVFVGPFMNNSKSIVEELLNVEAIKMGQNINDIVNLILECHKNPLTVNQQVINATQVMQKNQGSVLRYIKKIEEFL